MKNEVRVFDREKGQIQRVHVAYPESWDEISFLHPEPATDALSRYSHIYREFLVPACPWLFGNMIMFSLPEGLDAGFPMDTGKFGTVSDPLIAAAAALRRGVRILRGKPHFRDAETDRFWQALEQAGAVHIVSGKLPITTIIPVSNNSGYLTQSAVDARLKTDASFFIMDRFDCATVYDRVGTVLGLCVKDGVVSNPPLYHREALVARKDGTVRVELPQLADLQLQIGEHTFIPGKNASVYTRPRWARSPGGKGKKLVIIGCTVAAVAERGSVPVPASGFVLCVQGQCDVKPGDKVVYRGMEDVSFAIQVGNSVLKDGEKTLRFISKFYNLRALEPVPYPPSLYSPDFNGARAARMILGADGQGKPMVAWVEGAAKLGQIPGVDSCGASLAELPDICLELGMVHAVNLDGGGSAQLLIRNQRKLKISDRVNDQGLESERPIPLGLVVH